MKYNGKAYCNISHGYLWRWEIKKNTDCFQSCWAAD
jgi:hypothetical protein